MNSDYTNGVEWWADSFIINNGSERMWEETVEAQQSDFPGIRLDGWRNIPRNLPGLLASRPRLETETFRIEARSVTAWDNFLGFPMLLPFQTIRIMLYSCRINYSRITILFLFCWGHVNAASFQVACLLRYNTVQSGGCLPTFRRNVQRPFLSVHHHSSNLKMEAAPRLQGVSVVTEVRTSKITKDFYPSFHIFKEIKVGLCYLHAVCVSVISPITLWIVESIFTNLDKPIYHGIWAHFKGALHKSLPSVCLYVHHSIIARQRQGKNVAAATSIRATIELLDALFLMRSVSYWRKVGDEFSPELLVSWHSTSLIVQR
jgi:hypothetical protein